MEPIMKDVGGMPIKYNVINEVQSMATDKVKAIAKNIGVRAAVMFWNSSGNKNIALGVRAFAVLGFKSFYIIGKKNYDARPEVGAKHYIDLHKLSMIDIHTFFDENNMAPVLVEQGGSPLEEFDFKPYIKSDRMICFIMGNESEGFPPELLRMGFPRITIAQYGLVRSLNVSIASSIVAYEYLRQWRHMRMALL
jgi:tRNA(Leu) C34 or U34 (ribose-2'-O)-methylase TrmL